MESGQGHRLKSHRIGFHGAAVGSVKIIDEIKFLHRIALLIQQMPDGCIPVAEKGDIKAGVLAGDFDKVV
jgi:hypothetical protein